MMACIFYHKHKGEKAAEDLMRNNSDQPMLCIEFVLVSLIRVFFIFFIGHCSSESLGFFIGSYMDHISFRYVCTSSQINVRCYT